MKPTLLILAAGRGSRFGGAKQVSPMGPSGETIMEYSIYDAITSGFGKIVLVINREVEEDTKNLISKIGLNDDMVAYAYQDEYTEHVTAEVQAARLKPWGTGHAIMCAEEHINTPFAMINADDFYGREAFETMAKFLSGPGKDDSSAFSMVGYDLINTVSENGTVSRGISVSDEHGLLSSITETHGIFERDGDLYYTENDQQFPVREGLASMNFWGFQPILFDELHEQFEAFVTSTPDPTKDEFVIPAVIDSMIKNQRITVAVLHSSAKWFGVTYKEDKPVVIDKLKTYVDKGIYSTPLTLS